MYLSEVAPANLRGGLNSMFSANMVSYATQTLKPWGWRLSLGSAAFPALLMTLGG